MRKLAVFLMIVPIILVLGSFLGSSTVGANGNSDTTTTKIRPASWEVVEDDGSHANPEYAYDNEFDDTTSKAVIKSPGGVGSHTKIYESLAYTFDLEAGETNTTLVYTWSTKIGHGHCWDGSVQIFLWNWGTVSWDGIGRWGDQDLATRSLGISPEYVNSDGVFKVKFGSGSGCDLGDRHASTIDLYDVYVTSEASAPAAEVPAQVSPAVPTTPAEEPRPQTVPVILSILIPVLGVMAIAGASIRMKVHRDYKRLSKIVVSSMTSKVSAIVSVVAALGFAAMILIGGGRIVHVEGSWLLNMTTTDIISAVIMIPLVGLVMGLFAYSIQKCGVFKSKQAGAGVAGTLVALIASLAACCGPVAIALLGAGAAVVLAQYSTMLTSFSIIILVFAVVLMTTNIKKEEECVCCASEDAVE